jgi:hypothetical protein
MVTRTRVDVARAARLFHALSDETRLHILDASGGGDASAI